LSGLGGLLKKAWWVVLLLAVAGAAAWFFWPEVGEGSGSTAASAAGAGASSANEGFVPEDRKPSAWSQPVSPRGGNSIRGRVLGPSGPVAGAQVTATAAHGDDVLSDLTCKCDNECGLKLLKCGCPEASGQIVELVSTRAGEAQPVARAISAQDGSFVLEGLDEAEVAIWADAKEGVGYLATAKPGQENADVALGPGRFIEGKVVSGAGKGLEGALVSAIYAERSRFFETLTTPAGTFKLGPVPPGSYAVVAMSSGLLPDHSRTAEEEGPPLELKLHVPRSLSGTVTHLGKPVAGAKVALDGEHRKRKAETDAEGKFVFVRLRPGEYELEAKAAEGSALVHASVAADADRTGLTIEIARGARLSGFVRDGLGNPVAGAKVLARGEDRKTQRETSGPDGAFSFENLPPRTYWLGATLKGYLETEPKTVQLGSDGREGEVVVLQRAVLVSGAAVDEDGRKVDGYEVMLLSPDAGRGMVRSGRGTADAGFELEALPGRYGLTVRSADYLTLQTAADAPSSGLLLVLKRGASVAGRVVDAEGLPLDGWEVEAHDAMPKERGDDALEDFDFDFETRGTFKFGLSTDGGHYLLQGFSPGRYSVTAQQQRLRGPGGRSYSAARASKEVELRGTERAQLELRVPRGLELSGRVVDAQGAPVTGSMVSGVAAQGGGAGYAVDETDEAGAFKLSGLQPGKYELRAMGPKRGEHAVAKATAQAGDTAVQLVLAEARKLVGRVVDEAGRPLASFSINDKRFDAPDGKFELPVGEEQTKYFFFVSASGYAQTGRNVTLSGPRTDVGEIAMSRGRPVSGRVIAAGTGSPVAGALVDVAESRLFEGELAEPRLSERNGAVRTDSQGRYQLPAVRAEVDLIVATAQGYVAAKKPLTADQTQVELVLTQGTTLKVTVLDKDGKPLEAMVSARNHEGRMVMSHDTNLHPKTVRTLSPGKWLVSALARGTRVGSAQLELKDQPEAEVTLREVVGGVSLTVQSSAFDVGAVNLMLAPGKFAFPTEPAAWKALWGLDTARPTRGKFTQIVPGDYTLLVTREAGRALEGFVMPVRVSAEPNQTVTAAPPNGWQATTW
jgi:protocatechuate 3,4-dioxygenase beta subunit